jgi:hypothetical protein
VLALRQQHQQQSMKMKKVNEKMLLRWHYWRNISLSLLFYIHSKLQHQNENSVATWHLSVCSSRAV